ncbi:tetratricopeptide repeat protein [Brucepastera parasyntrophica]|uniref:tetratricopeptide repeat protein n=1 Tax=Brucepastera parasyntrophica TaxID=2880008 RepID=UPI00210A8239|nr:tetratricopeptide repeat protein [Brucepastera parasyntrophica]ULQ59353.1 tetratricopeptide repeat protein [Brucepastera parasyntrophica]
MFSFLKRLFNTKKTENTDPDALAEELWQTDFQKEGQIRFNTEFHESYSSEITGQGLSLSMKKKNLFAWTMNPVYRYRDFVLEALLQFPDGTGTNTESGEKNKAGSSAAGFLFRYLNGGTFYSVLVSDTGLLRFDAVINSTPFPVLGWTEMIPQNAPETADEQNAAALPYTQKNVFSLRIIAQGTSFTFILNDNWLAECMDDTIQAPGNIAFAGQNWNEDDSKTVILNAIAIESRPIEVETQYTRWNQFLRIPDEARINLAQTWYAMGRYVPAILELKKTNINGSANPELFLLLGQIYLAQRLYPEAENAVKKALELEPANIQAAAELGGIYYMQHRIKDLETLMGTLSSEDKNGNIFLSNLQGHLYSENGDHEKAANAYNTASLLNPDQGLFSYNAGRELMADGFPEKAKQPLLNAARIFLKNEEYTDLEETVRLLDEMYPDDAEISGIHGKYLYAVGKTEEALRYLKTAIDGNTADSAVWYLYGMVLSGQKKKKEAIESLEKAAELEPDCGLYYFRLAETLFSDGQDCTDALTRALETDSGNGWVFNLAAQKSLTAGDFAKAEEHILKARDLLPEENPVLINYAEIRRKMGKLEEILHFLDTDDAELLHAGANLLVADGRYEEAHSWYQRALKLNPSDTELVTDYAANCIEQDLFNEADDMLGKAFEIERTPRLYKLISYLAGRKGEFTRSEVSLIQGLNEFPDNPELFYELSGVYLATGRTEKAAEIPGKLRKLQAGDLADKLEKEIREQTVNTIRCSECGRSWDTPKNIPPQGILHITAQPPDDLPAGTCPKCGKNYCIGCAKENLGEDGRFYCRKCNKPLKLISQDIIWLLNQWQQKK